MATIREQCMGVKDYVIEMRRKLHQIPELGINNPQTQAVICAELDKMGVPYQKNTVVHDGVQDTGVVAFIEGKNTDKVIALRADVDALPVLEKLLCPTSPSMRAKCTPAATTTTALCCWVPPRSCPRSRISSTVP